MSRTFYLKQNTMWNYNFKFFLKVFLRLSGFIRYNMIYLNETLRGIQRLEGILFPFNKFNDVSV